MVEKLQKVEKENKWLTKHIKKILGKSFTPLLLACEKKEPQLFKI